MIISKNTKLEGGEEKSQMWSVLFSFCINAAPGDLTFAPGQTNTLVSVAANVDSTVEIYEYFTARATLVSTDAAVTINPEIAFVNIEDNDSE